MGRPERDIIDRVKRSILQADREASLSEILNSDVSAFEGFRVLYSSATTGIHIPIEEKNKVSITSMFSEKFLLAYSDPTLDEMLQEESTPVYQPEAILDTNILSELPNYLCGLPVKDEYSVKNVIESIGSDLDGQFDYTFPMFENLRFYKDNNPHPVRKVAAALYLSHIYQSDAERIDMGCQVLDPYMDLSEEKWTQYRSNPWVWHMIDRRDVIYAVMLKAYCLCWEDTQISVQDFIRKLVDFSIHKLGVFPLKELYFSWKAASGLRTGNYMPVFDEPPLKQPNKDTLNRLGALAWDLFFFRYTESLLSIGKGSVFNIPYVTTLDNGLRESIALCRVKAVICSRSMGYVETIFEDELEFQILLDESLSLSQLKILQDPSRNIKGKISSKHSIIQAISDMEHAIRKMQG